LILIDPEGIPLSAVFVCRLCFEWALTDRWNYPALDKQFRRFEVNRNAATYLSTPSKRLGVVIREHPSECRLLLDFLSTDKSTDQVFACNFQQIVECVFWQRIEWAIDPSFLSRLIEFSISNVHILCYHQLLMHIAIDCPRLLSRAFGGLPGFGIRLLKGIACHVVDIEATLSSDILASRADRLLQALTRANYPYRIVPDRQAIPRCHHPLTIERREFPPPLVIDFQRGEHVLVSNAEYDSRRQARQNLADYTPSSLAQRDSSTRAYLLLNCFQTIGKLNPAIFDLRLDQLALELLLMCGIYSDANSMVSVIAFKLLYVMIYGKKANPDLLSLPSIYFNRDIMIHGKKANPALESLPSIYFNPEVIRLIDDYAQDFDFSSNITPQMLAAFPIFWNHRYAHLATTKRPLKYPPLTIEWNPPLSGEQVKYPKSVWRRPLGLTPLEFYGRFLLEDPPLSDRFNGQMLRILRMIDREQKRLMASVSQDDYLHYQKILTEKAIIVFDFLRTEFPFEGEMVDMRVLSKFLPLKPTDPILWTLQRRCRVPLNGAIIAFANFLSTTCIFDLADGTSPLFTDFTLYLSDEASYYTSDYLNLMNRPSLLALGRRRLGCVS
jgi:hypothetical protein